MDEMHGRLIFAQARFLTLVVRLYLLTSPVLSCGCSMLASHAGNPNIIRVNTSKYNTDAAKQKTDLAISLVQQRKWRKAQDVLQQALVADATYGPAHNNLGMLYYQQGKYYFAAWEFERAQMLMPERAEPYNNLGMVYEAISRFDEAIAWYQIAYEMNPTDAEYLGNLARAKVQRGDEDEYLAHLWSELLLYDSRPSWVQWAEEQLALSRSRSTRRPSEAVEGTPIGSTFESMPEVIPPPDDPPADRFRRASRLRPAGRLDLRRFGSPV